MSAPHPGILELSILPTLSVHCFSRDGREAGPGPLFILREWDLKVIRTIGHKPKCKGPNQEQALRACVRQGLLSMQLKTENATKDEIQLLKQVGVLGKRAPSGSLIGGADLLRLLEYFSKRDVADAFRACMKKKREEGVVSEEVWKEIAAVREKDVLHKFKINTEDSRSGNDEEQRGGTDKGGKGGERKKKKSSGRTNSGGQSRKASSSKGGKSKKRRADAEEGGGRKRRRGSESSSSLRSSSSSSSMSSLDSDHGAGRKRGREQRNGHKNRTDSPERRERGERDGQALRLEEYPAVVQQHELLQQPPGVFADVRMAYAAGQRRQVGGGHTVQLLQQGQLSTLKREMNGDQQQHAASGIHRGQFAYSTSASPTYALPSSIPQTSSPTSAFNGLYNTGRLPSYNSLTSLSSLNSYAASSSPPHLTTHIHPQQQPSAYSSPPHGAPLLATVSISPVTAHVHSQGGAGQKQDGLEVLMQALHGKEQMHDGQANGGQVVHAQRRSSSPRHIGHGQSQQLQQQHGNHDVYAQQQQQQSQMELQRAQHLQSQHHQLYAQQQHIQQQQQQQQQPSPPSSYSHQLDRAPQQAVLPSYLHSKPHKDSPPFLANSSFTYALQSNSPSSLPFHIKKEGVYTTASLGHPTTATVAIPSRVSVSLPSNVASSSILSPLTLTLGSTTPTHASSSPSSSLAQPHRPHTARSSSTLSPANSFTNLAALASNPSSSNLTRTISSSSLTLGLPSVSSVTSLSSLGLPSTSLSYTHLHTSMSMTSLDAHDRSDADDDDDDDLGGDAGIQNGIIGFDDDIEGGEVGGRGYGGGGVGGGGGGGVGVGGVGVGAVSYYTYDPSSSSPLPRIPSMASLTAVGGVGMGPMGGVGGMVVGVGGVGMGVGGLMQRVGSNLSTLTSQFLPSPPSSRPSSPRGVAGRDRMEGGHVSPQLGHAGGDGGRDGGGGAEGSGMGQGVVRQSVPGTALTAEG